MLTWKISHRPRLADWSLDDFVRIASGLLVTLGIERPDTQGLFELKDRLVRYYTSAGALRRPGREGKEARYGYEHLVQLLVTRQLLNEGWPLAKAADFIQAHDLRHLESLLPDHDTPFGEARRTPRSRTRAETELIGIRESMMTFEESAMRENLSMQSTMRALGNPSGRPEWKDAASIDITPWCTVIVNMNELKQIPPGSAELVGEALAHALNRLRMTRRERK